MVASLKLAFSFLVRFLGFISCNQGVAFVFTRSRKCGNPQGGFQKPGRVVFGPAKMSILMFGFFSSRCIDLIIEYFLVSQRSEIIARPLNVATVLTVLVNN